MPNRLPRPCRYPGCPELTAEGYCEKHKQEKHGYDRYRGSAIKRGYDYAWQQASKAFLREHPLCACDECAQLPVPKVANVVDHIQPHKGNRELFWDVNNWQAMNKECHDRKTAQEDGGFGNKG